MAMSSYGQPLPQATAHGVAGMTGMDEDEDNRDNEDNTHTRMMHMQGQCTCKDNTCKDDTHTRMMHMRG